MVGGKCAGGNLGSVICPGTGDQIADLIDKLPILFLEDKMTAFVKIER